MIFADLHLHGKYSRATSKDLTIDNLEHYAKIKGLNLLGTGDFTHPKWFEHLKDKLKNNDEGIFVSKKGMNFILQTELSLIYTQGDKGRRVHHIILAPDFDSVEQINEELLKKGRLDYDGRPIFGFSSIELVEMMRSINKKIEIIPAHIWTPWFGLLGSKSGFDSVKECFQEKTKYIHALETGLSSDPKMNWRLSSLDKFSLISNSDSHSFWPWRIGRECNVFDSEFSYHKILDSIKTKKNFVETIEVDPAYGKYHLDGHRNCNLSLEPKESIKNQDVCPKCGKLLTIGVLHRVELLADRPEGYVLKNSVPFKRLIPLSEIIGSYIGIKQLQSKGVSLIYDRLIKKFGNEFDVLLNISKEDLLKELDEKLVELILKNRRGEIKIKAGFDGLYGTLLEKNLIKQKNVLNFEKV